MRFFAALDIEIGSVHVCTICQCRLYDLIIKVQKIKLFLFRIGDVRMATNDKKPCL